MKTVTLTDIDTVLYELQFHTGQFQGLGTNTAREWAREEILRLIERDSKR